MPALNKVMLIGAVGKDPEVRQFQDGGSICSFTLATSETYTDRNGQRQEQTEWHNVVLGGKLTNLAQFLHKGSKLYVEGKLRNRSWQSQDGQKHYVTEAIIDSVEFAGSRSDGSGQSAQPAQPTGGQPNRNPNGTIPGIMQPPRIQQQRMDLNAQQNNDFMEVDDDELPF